MLIRTGYAWQLVIELSGGIFVPCNLMQGMVTRVAANNRGAAAIIMQPGYSDYGGIRKSIQMAELAIARLNGEMSVGEVSNLAVRLRMEKHFNPVLGVISAYLYDAIGDLANIRRMAYYYVQNQQAVPFDIVFLGDMTTWVGADGMLQVNIPAQEARSPRTKHEAQWTWTTEATSAVTGVVAGRMPWMRRGWPYISSPTDAERLMTSHLMDLDGDLLPARFTTLNRHGGRGLVDRLGLERIL